MSNLSGGRSDPIVHDAGFRYLEIIHLCPWCQGTPQAPSLSPFSHTVIQTANFIVNLDHDEWILEDDSKMLADLGFGNGFLEAKAWPYSDRVVENETEVRFSTESCTLSF